MKTVIFLVLYVSLCGPLNQDETQFDGKKPWHDRTAMSAGTGLRQALFRQQIPILCYHNIHELHRKDNPYLTVTDSVFDVQLKSLYDSGYHTISPDQLYQYLSIGIALPPRSFLISFDDSHAEDYAIAEPVLQRYGFKAIFFVTTGYLDRNKHLSTTEIKELSYAGNSIAAHTWDHPNLRTSKNFDWKQQLYVPREQLEAITGKPIDYFAYPYGSWNHIIIDSIKHYGYKAAFQLNGKQSNTDPLYTIRRITVSDKWSSSTLQLMMKRKFA